MKSSSTSTVGHSSPVAVRALTAAIADAKYEREGGEIEYYVDADVVLGAICPGVRLAGELELDGKSKRGHISFGAITRSLWIGGLLGRFCMSWPHAGELQQKLASPEFSKASETKSLELVLKHIKGLQLLSSLKQAARASGTDELVKALTTLDFRAIVALDAICSGNAKARREQTADLITIESDPMRQQSWVSGQPGFYDLAMRLAVRRGDVRPQKNSVADAAAILLMSDRRNENSRRVRFYTQTDAMRNLCSADPLALRLLADCDHPKNADYYLDAPWAAIRSSRYFVLRATFPALRPKDALGAIPAGAAFERAISDLQRVAERLETVDRTFADQVGGSFDQFLEELGLPTTSVQVSEEMVHTAFVRDVWLSKLETVLSGLGGVPESLEETVRVIGENESSLRKAMEIKFESSVRSLVSLADASIGFRSLYESLVRVRRRHRVPLGAEGDEALVDLAADRWFGEKDGALVTEARRVVTGLVQASGEEEGAALAKLFASISHARERGECDCVGIVGALSLGATSFVRSAILSAATPEEAGCEVASRQLIAAWLLIAEGGRFESAEGMLRRLRELREQVVSKDGDSRIAFLSAVGWLAFYALETLPDHEGLASVRSEILHVGQECSRLSQSGLTAGTVRHDYAAAVDALLWAERIRQAVSRGEPWDAREVPVRLISEEHLPRGASFYVEDAWAWLELVERLGGIMTEARIVEVCSQADAKTWLEELGRSLLRPRRGLVERYHDRHLRLFSRAFSAAQVSFGEVDDRWFMG